MVKEASFRLVIGGAVGLIERAVMDGWWTGGKDVWGIWGLVGRWGWDVESPHILADSFRANKDGCRISRRKDGECGRCD